MNKIWAMIQHSRIFDGYGLYGYTLQEERAIRTLRAWDIRIDETFLLGGLDKVPFLKTFQADIFFDDQRKHCESARLHVAAGQVPSGIKNT